MFTGRNNPLRPSKLLNITEHSGNKKGSSQCSLNWPMVADMIKVETACMVYKSINDLAPDYLSEIFTKTSACCTKI